MSYIHLGHSIYRDSRTGFLYERPKISGKRTWRKLDSQLLKYARAELAAKRSDQARARQGLARCPYGPDQFTVGQLIGKYRDARCPTRNLEPRVDPYLKSETDRLDKLLPYWKDIQADAIKVKHCGEYFSYRKRQMREGVHGGRAVDLELTTLNNCLRWSLITGRLEVNRLDIARPKYRGKTIRHCREFMPLDGDELHALARFLFENPRSEALGWQLLLTAMTGCRTSEVLRLRRDAKTRQQAGFIEGDWLWLQRSKGGVNPFAAIHPALRECLDALDLWHAQRQSGRKGQRRQARSPFFVPGRLPDAPMDATALTHALERAGAVVAKAHRTSHGLRAYYVTMRRSEGIADGQIAAEIGDRSGPAIISQTYGDIPPNWKGAAKLSWMPDEAKPAWDVFGFPKNAVALRRKA